MAVEEQEFFSLPPGYHFRPTDYELLIHYLYPKLAGVKIPQNVISTVDIYKHEPWDLPHLSKLNGEILYFLCPRESKSSTGLRTNRSTIRGHWKSTGKDRKVSENELKKLNLEARKKTLVYYLGRAPKGTRTDWVMHEYRLEGKNLKSKDDFVLCRVLNKRIDDTVSKNVLETEAVKEFQGVYPKYELFTDVSNPNACSVPTAPLKSSNSNPQSVIDLTENLDFEISSYTENCNSNHFPTAVTPLQNPSFNFSSMDTIGILPSSSNNSFCSLSSSIPKDSPHSEINESFFNMIHSISSPLTLDGEVENPMEDISNLLHSFDTNPLDFDVSLIQNNVQQDAQIDIHMHDGYKPPDPCYQTWPTGPEDDFWDCPASFASYPLISSDEIKIEDFIVDYTKDNLTDANVMFDNVSNSLQCSMPDVQLNPNHSNPFLQELEKSTCEETCTHYSVQNNAQDNVQQCTFGLNESKQSSINDYITPSSFKQNELSTFSCIQKQPSDHSHPIYDHRHHRSNQQNASMKTSSCLNLKPAAMDSQNKVKEDFVNMLKKKMENLKEKEKPAMEEEIPPPAVKIKLRSRLGPNVLQSNPNNCEQRFSNTPRTRMVVPKPNTEPEGYLIACEPTANGSEVSNELKTEQSKTQNEEESNTCARSRLFVRKQWHRTSQRVGPNLQTDEPTPKPTLEPFSEDRTMPSQHESRQRVTSRWIPSSITMSSEPLNKKDLNKTKSYPNSSFFPSRDSIMKSLAFIPSPPAHAHAHATTMDERRNESHDDGYVDDNSNQYDSMLERKKFNMKEMVDSTGYSNSNSSIDYDVYESKYGNEKAYDSENSEFHSCDDEGLTYRDSTRASSSFPSPSPSCSSSSSSSSEGFIANNLQSHSASSKNSTGKRREKGSMKFSDRVLMIFIMMCFLVAFLPILMHRIINELGKHSIFRKTFYFGTFVAFAYFLFHCF